jgi:hypothetical protein
MRIREVIVEDVYDSMIQDEANDPVINTLLTHLVIDRSSRCPVRMGNSNQCTMVSDSVPQPREP